MSTCAETAKAGTPWRLHDSFSAVFGARRGTVHDPLVEAALKRIPALTNHLPAHTGQRAKMRLLLQDACLALERSPARDLSKKPILIIRGTPGGMRSSLAISAYEWLSEGRGFIGWKTLLQLFRGRRVYSGIVDDDLSALQPSLESLDTPALIEQMAHLLVYDWNWMSRAIGATDIV